MNHLEEDVSQIAQEIVRVSKEKHTGQMQITLHMNQGGIGQISVNIDKNLKNAKKRLRTDN